MNAIAEKDQFLTRLFDPRSIALIGASRTPGKWGFEYARQLLSGSDSRQVYLVNPRSEPILGHKTYSSISALPEAPDVAVICVPVPLVEQAVTELVELGTRYFVCITAGFKEAGREGQQLEKRITNAITRVGGRLVGPNCVGLYDAAARLSCTAFWDLPPGDVGVISQSGGLIVDLGVRLPRIGLGISRAVSVGNQSDLTVADFVLALTTDAATRVIVAYVEEFKEGRRLLEAIEFARTKGKEVLLLAPKASEAVGRSVASHTGSMISNEDVLAAACEDLDLVRLRGVGELMITLKGLSAPVKPGGRRVAVLADGGGAATLATDAAVSENLEVPAFSNLLQQKLHAIIPGSSVANPVDVVGALDLSVFLPVVQEIAASGEVDAILFNGVFNSVVEQDPSAERSVAERLLAVTADQKIAVSVATLLPDEPAMIRLSELNVPVFAYPGEAARCLSLSRARCPRRVIGPAPKPGARVQQVDYLSSRNALANAGLEFGHAKAARTPAEASRAAEELGFPVVLKALGQLHKSESGAVVLGLQNGDAVAREAARLQEKLKPDGFSVEKMIVAGDGVEILIGGIRDASFGPTIVVAAGGARTEVWQDRAVYIAPVDMPSAYRMIDSLKVSKLLKGFRGSKEISVEPVARAICRMSEFIAEKPNVVEVEVNPCIVSSRGCVAVDARIVVDEQE